MCPGSSSLHPVDPIRGFSLTSTNHWSWRRAHSSPYPIKAFLFLSSASPCAVLRSYVLNVPSIFKSVWLRVVQGAAVLVSLGSLWEIWILRPHAKPAEIRSSESGARESACHKLSGWFPYIMRNTVSTDNCVNVRAVMGDYLCSFWFPGEGNQAPRQQVTRLSWPNISARGPNRQFSEIISKN